MAYEGKHSTFKDNSTIQFLSVHFGAEFQKHEWELHLYTTE